jgi:hypothetical protein
MSGLKILVPIFTRNALFLGRLALRALLNFALLTCHIVELNSVSYSALKAVVLITLFAALFALDTLTTGVHIIANGAVETSC